MPYLHMVHLYRAINCFSEKLQLPPTIMNTFSNIINEATAVAQRTIFSICPENYRSLLLTSLYIALLLASIMVLLDPSSNLLYSLFFIFVLLLFILTGLYLLMLKEFIDYKQSLEKKKTAISSYYNLVQNRSLYTDHNDSNP